MGVDFLVDSTKIFETAQSLGARCFLTSSNCISGTDRVAECLEQRPEVLSKNAVIVNIQGDEPMLNPSHIDSVVKALEQDHEAVASTAVVRETCNKDFQCRNVVKVVKSRTDRALYFSRSPIPYSEGVPPTFFRHIGIYAYKSQFLIDKYKLLPESLLEDEECLEQVNILVCHWIQVRRKSYSKATNIRSWICDQGCNSGWSSILRDRHKRAT